MRLGKLAGSCAFLLMSAACTFAGAQTPATARVEIVGDYAGRMMTLKIDGRVAYEGRGQIMPPGVSWFLNVGSGNDAGTVTLQIEPCEEAYVTNVPRDGEDHALVVRGCEFRVLG